MTTEFGAPAGRPAREENSGPVKFLIVDGYPCASRQELQQAGVSPAHELFGAMLREALPEAGTEVLFLSDPEPRLPELAGFAGILWTGCNLTIHDGSDARVPPHLELARRAFQEGVPSFGSCWAIQVAAVAAGGDVRANPRGREIGVSRKIRLTGPGRSHPMYAGKPSVFDGFTSHLDEVTRLPADSELLAESDFTGIQAAVVRHGRGSFWATQYHTEFTMGEMARLMRARTPALLREGFFSSPEEAAHHALRYEQLEQAPGDRALRFQLGLDDDVLDPRLRRLEFSNWLRHEVTAHGT